MLCPFSLIYLSSCRFTNHPRNINKIKTDELGINAPISWTRRIQNISKIKIYILTRAALLFNLCYEIPCTMYLRVACTFSILWLRIQIVSHFSIRNYVEQRETVHFPGFDILGYFWIWKKFRTSTPSQWRQWFQVFCALFQTSCCTCCQNIFAAKRTFWVNDSFII